MSYKTNTKKSNGFWKPQLQINFGMMTVKCLAPHCWNIFSQMGLMCFYTTYIQWSLTYPDPIYPHYSVTWFREPIPIHQQKVTHLSGNSVIRTVWEQRCPDKWGSTVYTWLYKCTYRMVCLQWNIISSP